jgi:hypothetical protein
MLERIQAIPALIFAMDSIGSPRVHPLQQEQEQQEIIQPVL